MKRFNIICLLAASVMFNRVIATEITKDQIKGLDEQVQIIKKDVLAISAELNRLEEKLLFPSNTQVSFFVSLDVESQYEPTAIKIELDDKEVAHYIYNYKEFEALQSGGVQRVYTGNVRTGGHNVQVKVIGKQGGSQKKNSVTHTFNKGVGPKFVEIHLTGSGIEFRKW